MNCEQLVKYLSDYIDGSLGAELVAEAQEHLRTCQNCTVVLDSTQRTILLSRLQRGRRIPDDKRHALFDQIEAIFRQRKANGE
jgi:predicted anti-sigma-YlaC factor YlaD